MGAFLLGMLCSYVQPSEPLPLRVRQLVPLTSAVTSSEPPSLRREKMDNARKSILQMSPSSWMGCHLMKKVCGYGDKWRKRIGLGICSFSHSKHFSRCTTHRVFYVSCTVCRRLTRRALHQCQRTALLRSETGVMFGRCGLELHVRRWPPHKPFCFRPCHASCSRQFFSLSQAAKRISCTIDDSRGYTQHDIFTEPDTCPHSFTFRVFDIESQFVSRSCGGSIIFFASVDHAIALMRSD